MNQKLTNEISDHLVNWILKFCHSDFLLSKTLKFVSDNLKVELPVWSLKIPHLAQEIRLMIGACSEGADQDFAVLISLKGSPFYAIFQEKSDEIDRENMIATSLDGKAWIPCNHLLQGTFLAAMEQIKEMPSFPSKIMGDVDELFDSLVNFIDFRDGMIEREDFSSEDFE